MSLTTLLLALTTFWGIPAGAWVVIGTTASGVVLAWATKFFNRRVEARDDRRDYRDEIKELREELREQGNKIDKLEEEVTQWRDRYYAEQDYSQRLRSQIRKTGTEPEERKK